ncbi:MAG TPA: M15 family metallopeptidase [Candidatus Limnocylindria bacterium]
MTHRRPFAVGLALVLFVAVLAAATVAAFLPAGNAPVGGARISPTPGSAPASGAASPSLGPEAVVPGPPLARPVQPSNTARFETTLVDDHCVDRDLPAVPATDIVLTVLDRSYGLPSDYAPDDLVPASAAGFSGVSGNRLISARILDDLSAMHAAMTDAGLTILLDSAYRSYATQVTTFDRWVAQLGTAEALARSARPGHSEHQLGTALDITSPGWGGRFGDWAADSPEGAWLVEHAWEYGFVMSYPWDSQPDTCFSYEPWHYRWIGRDAAAEQRSSGLFLRQFLERFVDG